MLLSAAGLAATYAVASKTTFILRQNYQPPARRQMPIYAIAEHAKAILASPAHHQQYYPQLSRLQLISHLRGGKR